MRKSHLLFTVLGYQLDTKKRLQQSASPAELDALQRYTNLGMQFLCARVARQDTEELTRQMDMVLGEFRRAERQRRKAEKKAAKATSPVVQAGAFGQS